MTARVQHHEYAQSSDNNSCDFAVARDDRGKGKGGDYGDDEPAQPKLKRERRDQGESVVLFQVTSKLIVKGKKTRHRLVKDVYSRGRDHHDPCEGGLVPEELSTLSQEIIMQPASDHTYSSEGARTRHSLTGNNMLYIIRPCEVLPENRSRSEHEAAGVRHRQIP